ncbi:hypothetical protein [Allohahella marinimesophila]|uniref:Lipoprotein n=1 Tax=Allohahella marinimesophila TaxID=1054972 RepID=A0ABP7P8G5_9GAMM
MKLAPLKLATVLGGYAILAACAGKTVDTTPTNPTAVVEAKFTVNGRFVPDFSGVQTVYTRDDMRSIKQKTEFDSFVMRWLNSDVQDIFRLDKNLVWQVDFDNETYQECSLTGCTSGLEAWNEKTDSDEEEDTEDYESYEELGCQVELVRNDTEVKSTGKQRVISGMDAREYTMDWVVEFQDSAKRKDKSTVSFVFWTTDPDESMQAVWRTHNQFTEGYLKATKDSDPMIRLLGREGVRALSAFTGDIEKTDAEEFNDFTRSLAKIEGYPLSIKVEWYSDTKACQEARAPKASTASGGSLEDQAMDVVGGFFSKQAEKMVTGDKTDPNVRYIYEVTSASEQPIRDSQFAVPADFTLQNRQ